MNKVGNKPPKGNKVTEIEEKEYKSREVSKYKEIILFTISILFLYLWSLILSFSICKKINNYRKEPIRR